MIVHWMLLVRCFVTATPASTSWVWFSSTSIVHRIRFLFSFLIIHELILVILQFLAWIYLHFLAVKCLFAFFVFSHDWVHSAINTLSIVLLIQHVYRFTQMLLILRSRLNLIRLILNYLVFVSMVLISFNSSSWLILLKMSLIILIVYLIFHLRIYIILRREIMLPTVKRSSLMHIPLMSHWHLLLLFLVDRKININIIDILWWLLNHLILFCYMLLLLIKGHLLLDLLLLLLMIILGLWWILQEILLPYSRWWVHLMLLSLIDLSYVTLFILVLFIWMISYIITLVILLWSDVIIYLRCVYI